MLGTINNLCKFQVWRTFWVIKLFGNFPVSLIKTTYWENSVFTSLLVYKTRMIFLSGSCLPKYSQDNKHIKKKNQILKCFFYKYWKLLKSLIYKMLTLKQFFQFSQPFVGYSFTFTVLFSGRFEIFMRFVPTRFRIFSELLTPKKKTRFPTHWHSHFLLLDVFPHRRIITPN